MIAFKNYAELYKRLIAKYRKLCSWNNIQRNTFTKTFRELQFENNIHKNIQSITFRGLNSEDYDYRIEFKKLRLEDSIQKKTFRELYLKNNIQRFTSLSFFSCARKKSVAFMRNKMIFQNLEGADDFIKQQIKEICDRKKISVENMFCFYIFLCLFFSMILT